MSNEPREPVPWASTHEEWKEKWAPPCPDGNCQRLLKILGFRLKGADYLQLRVVLRRGDNGVCQLIVDEHPDRIYVRALSCVKEEAEDEDWYWLPTHEVDCPCTWWLDAPLGERIIIDEDSGRQLPALHPPLGDGRAFAIRAASLRLTVAAR